MPRHDSNPRQQSYTRLAVLKDALPTELQRRDAMGKKVEKCFHQVNLVSEKFAARVIFFRLLQTLR